MSDRNNKRLNDDIPLLKPDMVTMEYINALKKDILKKEIFRVVISWAVLALLAAKVEEYQNLITMVVGDYHYVQYFIVAVGLFALLFVLYRLKQMKGDEEEYGFVDGAVISSRKKIFSFKSGIDIRQEYIDIMSDYGNIYRNIPVFWHYSLFLSKDVSKILNVRLMPGDSVRIIRINSKTVYAVDLRHEFVPAKRKEKDGF